ncbi:MAG: insulinase family protein [Elusimicrobia bacterium]|nr:insulinase family protein [Elusimicrobiota bacterium]
MIKKTVLAAALAVLVLSFRPAIASSAPGPAAAPAEAWEQSSRLPGLVPEPLAGDPLRVTVHRLKNGLTVYLSPNREEPRVAAWIAVRAGSRHDPSELTGMAHYLEHMFFKGSRRLGTLDFAAERTGLDAIRKLYEERFVSTDTAKRSEIYGRIDRENVEAAKSAVPNELSKVYKQLGFRNINAFTSNDMTVYVTDLPRNRLAAWARLESDRFQSPVLRFFQSEIETVYEEKNRSMDNPDRILDEALSKTLFQDHPYGRTTLGSVEHLKNPSLERLYAFIDRHYLPNNMAVALAGDFDRKEALALIEREFGSWEPKPLTPPEAFAAPATTAAGRVEVRYESEEQVSIAWLLPPYGAPERDALTVLGMVLDNGRSGIVDLTLNQAQKVKRAGAGPWFLNEAGIFELWAVPKASQTLEEAESLLLAAVERLKAGEFTDSDLEAIITDFEINEKRKLESNGSRVSQMAMSFLHFEEWRHAAGRVERLRKVTRQDVITAARRHLGGARVTALRRQGKPVIASIPKPGFTKLDIAPDRESAFYRKLVSMPAKPIEPRWLSEGRDFRVLPAPWGKLVAARNPFNDLFSLEFVFERGWRSERSLCAALDLLGLSGGGTLSADDFKKKLYSLGTDMGTSCGEDRSTVRLSGLERNLEESLKLLFLRFGIPNTAPDTLSKMVSVKIGAHKDNKLNPSYVNNALNAWALRGSSSAVLGELTDTELRGLEEKGLLRLLKTFFDHPRRAGYVGTRDPRKVLPLLGYREGRFPAPPGREPRRYRRPPSGEVLFTHRDMVQAQVGITAADEVYDTARAVDYSFFSDYAGGGMSSVIFQEVREARSLAYSASGGYSPGDRKADENILWGALGTQADKTVEAATLLRSLLAKLPLTEERFGQTKRTIEERYRSTPTEFRDIPGSVFSWEDKGLTKDPRPERFKKSLSYALDDLRRFAARFEAAPKTVTVLGSRTKVDLDGLRQLGDFTEKPLDELFPY